MGFTEEFMPSDLPSIQEKSYLFSMLVWHERLLYGSSSDSSSEHQTAMQQLSERISHLGSNMRSMLSGRL
jgi:hypothetical protein